MHNSEASDVCNWIQSGKDCKDYKYKEYHIKMMQTEEICFTFVMKSGVTVFWELLP